jgi:hypothetical protein
MASLIKLKQIESGSALQTSAEVGTNFSQSVINVITTEIVGVLPDGVVSSSVQIELISASGYQELTTEVGLTIISGGGFVTTASFNPYTESIDVRMDSLENFSSSLDFTYATDAELAISQSNISVDMGEF